MRAGAADFVVKPVGAERLQVSLRNALAASALEGELAAHQAQPLRHALASRTSSPGARACRLVLRTAEKAAGSAIPVLIEGQSGVGKELIARAIHGSGERRAKPFVAVNCGAIPDNLVESLLFGHEKGAFTGATERHTRQVRRGLRRHAVPRRGRRASRGRAGQAPARDPGGRGRAGRRAQAGQGRRAAHLRHQPRPHRRREGRALPRRPVLSPARLPHRRSCRLRERPEDIPELTRHFLARFAAEEGKRIRRASAPRRWRCSPPIAGRATCASSRTRCSARSCWPRATRSAWTSFPQIASQTQPATSPSAAWRPSSRRAGGSDRREPAARGRELAPWPPSRPALRRSPASRRPVMPPLGALIAARCQRRRAPARGHRSRGHPLRHHALSRADVRGRAAAAHRTLDALPQAQFAGFDPGVSDAEPRVVIRIRCVRVTFREKGRG